MAWGRAPTVQSYLLGGILIRMTCDATMYSDFSRARVQHRNQACAAHGAVEKKKSGKSAHVPGPGWGDVLYDGVGRKWFFFP